MLVFYRITIQCHNPEDHDMYLVLTYTNFETTKNHELLWTTYINLPNIFLSRLTPYIHEITGDDEAGLWCMKVYPMFPYRVDNKINNKHSLRSNTKGYGRKTH